MSSDPIERVDSLIRKNNMKYVGTPWSSLEHKHKQEYEKELQEFEKKKKKDFLKYQAELVKEANKRAIEKTK